MIQLCTKVIKVRGPKSGPISAQLLNLRTSTSRTGIIDSTVPSPSRSPAAAPQHRLTARIQHLLCFPVRFSNYRAASRNVNVRNKGPKIWTPYLLIGLQLNLSHSNLSISTPHGALQRPSSVSAPSCSGRGTYTNEFSAAFFQPSHRPTPPSAPPYRAATSSHQPPEHAPYHAATSSHCSSSRCTV